MPDFIINRAREARLAVAGIRQMVNCRVENIPHDVCGKLVVAVSPGPNFRALTAS
jgi:hypothetical protein